MIGRQVSLGVPVAALRFDEPGNTVWAAGVDGSVVTVRLLDGHVTVRGSGYVDVAAAVPLSDGLRVAVAERSGEVLLAARAAADRATAAPLATLAAPVRAADLHPD
ncbi:MAG TPA: hypothetical protein VFO77_08160, partial [Actinoplanes sp.]|nr:hypothetical protein [Actinoplanes sp.]